MTRPLSLQLYRLMMTGLSPLLPYYLARRAKSGKEDKSRLQERFGKGYQPLATASHRIWLHAVSVGEVNAALALADELNSQFPSAHFIITTGTVTAASLVAQASDRLACTHCYAPFDAPLYVTRFLGHHRPDFGVIFESDFWPCLITGAHEAAIPLYLASAQMSAQSARKWQKYPILAKALFAQIKACFAHDEAQSTLFARFGISSSHITGSLKLPPIMPRKTDFAKDIAAAGKGRPILLGASTHEGEESQLLAISDHLHAQNCNHLLVIAPRHPERGEHLATLMPEAKRRSQGALPSADDRRYLCDSLGDMPSLYQACDIVWLGASFSGKGGHNPLEAAAYGKPVICGPSQFKNQLEYDQLRAAGVCHQISDAAQTADFITALYANPEKRKEIAKNAKAYAKKAQKRPAIVAKHISQDFQGAQS